MCGVELVRGSSLNVSQVNQFLLLQHHIQTLLQYEPQSPIVITALECVINVIVAILIFLFDVFLLFLAFIKALEGL